MVPSSTFSTPQDSTSQDAKAPYPTTSRAPTPNHHHDYHDDHHDHHNDNDDNNDNNHDNDNCHFDEELVSSPRRRVGGLVGRSLHVPLRRAVAGLSEERRRLRPVHQEPAKVISSDQTYSCTHRYLFDPVRRNERGLLPPSCCKYALCSSRIPSVH
mmetsp:Transcript_32627/g.69985  ORF Transcript_32627/g.69985 Transcript_32627/m.69985 type:complete len:156 (-) Transcript_32627:90-557(-)